MTPLILHRVKNGFLVAVHKGENFLDLAEAFVAHSAEDLVAHIEAHFAHPSAPAVVVPAEAVHATLEAVKAELADPVPVLAAPAEVQA
jgi:hypothetical protein